MRKILILLLLVIVTMSILWIFAGRQISEFVDQFKTTQLDSVSVQKIGYEGSGDGGFLILDGRRLNLSPLNPHVGSSKGNELAIAYAGKVFAFGPMGAADIEKLVGSVPPEDAVSFER